MPVTSYYSVGGEILGERTDGGGRTNYGVDALGSVTSTMVGDAVVNRYSYKPYGAELSRSGAGADPSFRWVGSLGYRRTGRSHSEAYVRARHYDAQGGRWTSVDPLWPGEPQYGYAGASVIFATDVTGLFDCRTRTASYCNWVFSDRGFYGGRCFCFVSGKICDFVNMPVDVICRLLSAGAGLGPLVGSACSSVVMALKTWAECVNRGLWECAFMRKCAPLGTGFRCWNNWLSGVFSRPPGNHCGRLYHSSPNITEYTRFACCRSMVRCEQTEYTALTQHPTGPCTRLDRLPFPIGTITTCSGLFEVAASALGFPPFPFSQNQFTRINAATKLCCSDKVWKGA